MCRNKRSVHQSSVSETKKGRHNASSLQFEETEQVHHVPTFQNGRYASCGRFVKRGRLADKNRSKGRLLCSSNSTDRSQISEVSMEEQNFQIQSSPIWDGISAKSVYKNTETGAHSVETSRSKAGHMARRHHIDAPESSHGNGSNKDYSVAAAETRLPHKHREVSTDANKTVRVHRVQNQHCHNETVSSRRENSENPTGMSRSSEEQNDDSEKTGKIDRKMTAAIRAILPAPLQYRHLQRLKAAGLKQNNQSYEAKVTLNQGCTEVLKWLAESIRQWNGKSVLKACPDIQIQTDASKTGWGAHCGKESTQGLWTTTEKTLHINALELKAVLFAVKAFTKTKEKCHAHIKVDNTTTMTYINRMGGTKSPILTEIAKDLWMYCISKQIMLTAEHVPGTQNQIADFHSRNYVDGSNWKLDAQIFQEVRKLLGPIAIDLFADRTNAQTKTFISWKPDQEAYTTDAFTIQWTNLEAYVFPQFCLIGRCLAKIRQDQATVVIVTPTWQTQPWYPELLELCIQDPILLPPIPNLMTYQQGRIIH